MKQMGLIDPKWGLSPADENAADWDELDQETKATMAKKMAIYAAQIDRMDQGIGKVVATLKEKGEFENTLIMFLSDNGASHEGGPLGFDRDEGKGGELGGVDSYQSYGLSWSNASNTPFRRHKHWVHEGGISTPFIVHWPGHTIAGSMTHEVAHVIDVMPTCCEVAGADYPDKYNNYVIKPMEGKSLKAVFEGETRQSHDILHWAHEGNHAIRAGKWKLVMEKDRPWELYDIEADRSEAHDLAPQKPELVKQLREQFQAWAERIGV
jgi:arylsulfatase